MNERIRALAEQALLGQTQYWDVLPIGFVERLTELIVRECLNVINQPNGVGDDDVIRISDDVKRHFGVDK